MKKALCFCLICALLPLTVLPAPKSKITLEEEVIQTIASFYPVTATSQGIHTYDKQLADYSSGSISKMIGKLNGLKTRIQKGQAAAKGVEESVRYKLMLSNVESTLLDLETLRWYRTSPSLYLDEVLYGLVYLVGEPDSSHVNIDAVIGRMRSVPGLLATAQKNIKLPPPVYVDIAIESVEPIIDFYKQTTTTLIEVFPLQATMLAKLSQDAQEALNDFGAFLDKVPTGAPTSFAIGKANFDYKLKHEYFLPYGSDSLLKIGESLLADARKAYSDFQATADMTHPSGLDSVYVPMQFTREDLIDYYDWEVNQVKYFISSHDLISIPEDIASVIVQETPMYMRPIRAGIAYQPCGPFDSNGVGIFYIRPIPDSLDRVQLEARYRFVHRRGFRGSVVHEAYPGHHLQTQLASGNPDVIRKWQSNTMLMEGWALYCEEMMYHAGLFGKEDPAQWLGILGGIRFRAARIVADVKLHTGQFTYDQCVDWLIDVLEAKSESDQEYFRKEVRRYSLNPTIQMSYLVGKRELMALREAMKKRDGDSFTLKKFHDAVLAQGSVPPALLWELLGLKRD